MVIKALKKMKESSKVKIDYPKQNEKVESNHYSFRIDTSDDCEHVEITFDEKIWKPCRLDTGFWWFDIHNHEKGTYNLKAKAKTKTGKEIKTKARKFKVV